MNTVDSPSFTSFDGWKCIATGNLETNVLAVKRAIESGSPQPVLIFDDRTGLVQEVDIRGTDSETLARLPQAPSDDLTAGAGSVETAPSSLQPRGRGRPKLGVIPREVTLLPRHWDWLATQPGGASVALRKLVEDARRNSAGREDKRKAQERAYQFMSTMAGNMAGFEEGSRALFAGDLKKFSLLIAEWPSDIRDYVLRLATSDEA
jgi:hypothetical protein